MAEMFFVFLTNHLTTVSFLLIVLLLVFSAFGSFDFVPSLQLNLIRHIHHLVHVNAEQVTFLRLRPELRQLTHFQKILGSEVRH